MIKHPLTYLQTRDQLIDNGYHPLPLEGKRPILKNWVRSVPPAAIDYTTKNTGITTATTPALDIDCDDIETVKLIADTIKGVYNGTVCRVGRYPRCVYFFRTSKPFKKIKYKFTRGNESAALEFLCDGQQVAVFGTHPGTKKPYSWPKQSLLDVPYNNLPYISQPDALELLGVIADKMIDAGWSIASDASGNVTDSLRLLSRPVENATLPDTPIGRALRYVDIDDYDSWIALGHSLKAAENNNEIEDGLSLWVAASSIYPDASEDQCAEKWKTFNPDRTSGISGVINRLRLSGVDDGFGVSAKDDFKIEQSAPPQENNKKVPKRDLLSPISAGVGEPIKWTVENYLESASIGVMYGDAATYKTFIALDIALSVCFNKPWLGLNRVDPGAVWLIAGEGRRGIQRRVAAWKKRNDVHEDDQGEGLLITEGSLALEDPDTIERLITFGNKHKTPKLIVIDTLSRNYGGDENDTGQVRNVIEHMARLNAEFGATVLILHHSKKEGGQYRGSSTIKANVDFLYSVKKIADFTTALTAEKMKDAEDPPETVFNLTKVALGILQDQWGDMQEVTSLVPILSKDTVEEVNANMVRDEILSILKRHPDGIGARELRDMIPRRVETIDDVKTHMIDACEIEIISAVSDGRGRPQKVIKLTEYGRTL